jgi:hypothetical protein
VRVKPVEGVDDLGDLTTRATTEAVRFVREADQNRFEEFEVNSNGRPSRRSQISGLKGE